MERSLVRAGRRAVYNIPLEHKCWELQLRELRFLSLERRTLRGDPYHSLQLPKRRLQRGRVRLFSRRASDRTSEKSPELGD